MTALHAFLYCGLFAYSSALLLNPSYAGAEITDSPRNSTAHQAPGAPGLPHHWTSAQSRYRHLYSPESKVWFSLVKGKLSEVYWPTIDTAQLTDMQFLITDGKTFMAEESRDLIQEVKRLDSHSLSYQQINRDPEGRFTLYKTYTTDPKADVLKIAVTFETHIPGVFVLIGPAAANTGLYDHAWAQQDALYAFDQAPNRLTFILRCPSTGLYPVSASLTQQQVLWVSMTPGKTSRATFNKITALPVPPMAILR